MKVPLQALLVEDSPDDADLLLRELRRSGFDVSHIRVETEEGMRQALRKQTWDVVLSDYSMPAFSAVRALCVLHETSLDLPFIIISGTIGEETAVEALKMGAHDFLVKGRLARLVPAIERELRDAHGRRERKRAEQALRESEAKFRQIVETAQEGIWVIDTSGRTIYANMRMAEMLGASIEEVIGAPVSRFMNEEWALLTMADQERVPKDLARPHEYRLTRSDGSEFWASLSTSAIANDRDERGGTLAMVTDITEQRKLQAHLMVSDRMASVGLLAAGVAHEINNPLSAVLGNLELAVGECEALTAELPALGELVNLRNELNDAREGAERVRAIVKDVMLFSRVDPGHRVAVDVHGVLDSSVRVAWNEIRHRALVVKDYKEIPVIYASASRLGQVFLNLIVNAAHAIAEGQAEENEIRLCTRCDTDSDIIVEVRDTGSGMPPEVMQRLFTPFFTTKPVGVGTGLGLSICHQIVTGLGGDISVESQPRKGTLFRVRLPIGSPSPSQHPPTIPIATSVSRRGRVLVIDDDPLVGGFIGRALEDLHDVTFVTRARQGLDILSSGAAFDAILCDLMMPEMTGMDFCAELECKFPDQAEALMFLTGGAFTAAARSFLETNTKPCLEKPFDLATLGAFIRRRVK